MMRKTFLAGLVCAFLIAAFASSAWTHTVNRVAFRIARSHGVSREFACQRLLELSGIRRRVRCHDVQYQGRVRTRSTHVVAP